MFTAKTLFAVSAVFVLFTSGLANAIPHPAGGADLSIRQNISQISNHSFDSAAEGLQASTTAIDRHDSRKVKPGNSD